MKKATLILLLLGTVILVACQPQTVEVTRVVTETETVVETVTEQVEVEVTRVVEGEVVTETVIEEVEVTRVVETEVEVMADPTACNLEAPSETSRSQHARYSLPDH